MTATTKSKWPPANSFISVAILLRIICSVAVSLSSASADAANTSNSNGNNKSGQLGPMTNCSMSEFTCTNGKCVPINKYCDKVNDCGDSSDEPRFCTKCNRTYYGNLGITYNMELHRPKEDRIPYICDLTFTAAGGLHGDIIQITIESFTLGRFVSYTVNGCPDGYLQISEATRTHIGGMWCGTSEGPIQFFSETRTLVLTVKLFKLAKDQSGYNFDFRILYKVLPRDAAFVRFGGVVNEEYNPWYINGTMSVPPEAHYDEFENIKSHAKQSNYDTKNRWTSNGNNYGGYSHRITSDTNKNNTDMDYAEPKYDLGTLIAGTHCSRIFSDCDTNVCRLQSPNFPGVYPRNLTCYYAVRQHNVPPGKHALITVKQPKGNLVWIQTPTAASTTAKKGDKEKSTLHISTWNECDTLQDYITIYDGYTTREPVLLKFCGGGESVPAATSSGPVLLVEFTTSPYGTFVQTPSSHSLNGFQLEIEVNFVDIQSPTYIKNSTLCEFWIRGTGHGELESPRHSLPPNSTCLYHLQGTETPYRPHDQFQLSRRGNTMVTKLPRFKVWISLLKFKVAAKFGVSEESLVNQIPVEDCDAMLRIWDGPLREPPICKDLNCEKDINSKPIIAKYGQNFTNLIARYCYGRIPRSCDRGMLNETRSRPCTVDESFVSSGGYVTLELKNTESSVLRPVNFKLRYEFVDLQQDGTAMGQDNECQRKFVSNQMDKKEPIVFRSTRNIFLFGRGGAGNLKCVYRFEAQRDERIRIIIRRLYTRTRQCLSRIDSDTKRSYCFGDTRAKLEIMEQPWYNTTTFLRGCGCNSMNESDLPIIYTSSSREIEIHFTAVNMTSEDDPDNLSFEATYEFIKGPMACKELRKVSGGSGSISVSTDDSECNVHPWIIEPSLGKYLYVRLNGVYLRKHNAVNHLTSMSSIKTSFSSECQTNARIILTNGEGLSVTACPATENAADGNYVDIYSSGWDDSFEQKDSPPSREISVEYLYPDRQEYIVTWFEMVPRVSLGLIAQNCMNICPEMDACVNTSIWCDGVNHCPSGYDESFTHCSALLKLPAEILAALCVVLILIACGGTFWLYRKIKRHFRGSSILQTRLKSLSSMDTATLDEKEVIS